MVRSATAARAGFIGVALNPLEAFGADAVRRVPAQAALWEVAAEKLRGIEPALARGDATAPGAPHDFSGRAVSQHRE